MGGGGGKAGKRRVKIPHAFCIGVYPVTQGQWQALMGNNPSYFSQSGVGAANVKGISDADLKLFPVEQVSWDDTLEFLKRLNARENSGEWVYRLPTEAEWEYACRGGPVSKHECSFPFYFDKPSNSLCSTQANFDGNYPEGEAAKGPYLQHTSKVGSYKPNRLGIYDMHGNVWEWCDDWYDASASQRVYRGGCWDDDASRCQAAYRNAYEPSSRYYDLGLRLARVPVGTQSK
jgi:formylglycine-generating enzyme required for sulfatase activity